MHPMVISVDGIWKRYQIGGRERGPDTFREMLTNLLTAPFRSASRGLHRQRYAWFWALSDVRFSVGVGEVLGIIGKNGAGKSTLLKILSRITEPTEGRAEIRGRLASLLEVGTGFHPELTGRENIYLNGAILGMTRAEIQRRFDEIVTFAEVEKFLDTAVKRYSSGMAVRLAFSIAAHLDADILLVDEVLAVGDMQFQRKCLGKMGDVTREGRTVLFVSHNLGAISKLCSKGLVLHEGRVVTYGNVNEALRAYTKLAAVGDGLTKGDFFGPLREKLEFKHIFINDQPANDSPLLSPSQAIRIRARGEAHEELPGYRTSFSVYKDGQRVISRQDSVEPETLPKGPFESEVVLPPYFLSPGEYSLAFGGHSAGTGTWMWSHDEIRFSVVEEWSKEYDTVAGMGLVNLPHQGRRLTKG